MCNLFIKLGNFPDSCKIPKLKSLFKKESKINPSNHRPILLLYLISKIIEKFIHEQTSSFLSNKKLLYNYQSGFRENHSTDSCLTFLHNKILKGFDKGLMNGMILVDLQKAFDIIDHDIQLKKLSTTGLLDYTIGWFKSCLSNQLFRVNLENCYSDPTNIRYCFSYTRMICHRLLNQICFYMLMTRDLFFRERIRPGNKTSWRRHSVHPSDVARTSQMKHPTTS